jgi:hypothetical protein
VSVETSEHVVSQSRYRGVSRGTRESYRVCIDSIASGLNCRPCIDLRSLVDLVSCSRCILREQMRSFHDFHDLYCHVIW